MVSISLHQDRKTPRTSTPISGSPECTSLKSSGETQLNGDVDAGQRVAGCTVRPKGCRTLDANR
jgi:hypothetical protein